VPSEVRVATLVAFGFLAVCLLNSVGLILAKFSSSAGECSVRRALGASKFNIFGQCLTETAVVGAVGGLLGLALTALGLQIERNIIADNAGTLTSLDSGMVIITLTVAVLATVSSGLYPAWRASNVQPARQLRAR
jgi:putative ABC transport system permease protein